METEPEPGPPPPPLTLPTPPPSSTATTKGQTASKKALNCFSVFESETFKTLKFVSDSELHKASADEAEHRAFKLKQLGKVLWVLADLVVLLQASVQLLQAVQVKLLLQLGRLAHVLQHLLGEATREAAADLIDDSALQPHVPLSQQPVAQVVPVETERR